MLPMLQAELVQRKKWVTDEELLDYFVVGQSTPGIIAVNVATFAGYKKAKIFGGIVATLGMIFPSILIITVLAGLISSIDELPLVQKALKGINVAVCALITDATVNFTKKSIKGFVSILILLCSFSLIFFLSVPTYFIIIGAFLLGIAVHFISRKVAETKTEKNDAESQESQRVSEDENAGN